MNKKYLSRIAVLLIGAALVLALLTACGDSGFSQRPVAPDQARELVLYSWADYMPQSVLDAFTRDSGIKVKYIAYNSQEEAAGSLRAGKVYDVVLLPPEQISSLIGEGKLTTIDIRKVPNIKYVSENFRDLTFDPGSRYSVPYHWGTIGLLVRTDLVKRPVTRWSDLWDQEFAGKIALWPMPSYLLSISLKSLGHSVNTVDPAKLKAALQHLLKLKQQVFFIDNNEPSIVPALASGKAVIAYGWSYDALTAKKQGLTNIRYILPEEGTFLWMESFVIPANSSHRHEAELFLNFLLRPEIAGRIVNELYYAAPSYAADPFILPDILGNPIVYPSIGELRKAEMSMPLSAEGKAIYETIGERLFPKGAPK